MKKISKFLRDLKRRQTEKRLFEAWRKDNGESCNFTLEEAVTINGDIFLSIYMDNDINMGDSCPRLVSPFELEYESYADECLIREILVLKEMQYAIKKQTRFERVGKKEDLKKMIGLKNMMIQAENFKKMALSAN